MLPLYIYETSTGRVLAAGTYDERGDAAASARVLAFGAIDPATEYAPAGVKTARPRVTTMLINKQSVLANGADSVSITVIPVGSKVSVFKDAEDFARAIVTVNDGTLVATFEAAGNYRILVRLFPNVDVTFLVSAT